MKDFEKYFLELKLPKLERDFLLETKHVYLWS